MAENNDGVALTCIAHPEGGVNIETADINPSSLMHGEYDSETGMITWADGTKSKINHASRPLLSVLE